MVARAYRKDERTFHDFYLKVSIMRTRQFRYDLQDRAFVEDVNNCLRNLSYQQPSVGAEKYMAGEGSFRLSIASCGVNTIGQRPKSLRWRNGPECAEMKSLAATKLWPRTPVGVSTPHELYDTRFRHTPGVYFGSPSCSLVPLWSLTDTRSV